MNDNVKFEIRLISIESQSIKFFFLLWFLVFILLFLFLET